jgi:hypothetical protein
VAVLGGGVAVVARLAAWWEEVRLVNTMSEKMIKNKSLRSA